MKTTTPLIEKEINGRLRTVKATGLDENRVRFNWGYHDGASEQRNFDGPAPIRGGDGWRSRHFDPVYVAGWNAGFYDAKSGASTESSERAWQESEIAEGITPYRFNA